MTNCDRDPRAPRRAAAVPAAASRGRSTGPRRSPRAVAVPASGSPTTTSRKLARQGGRAQPDDDLDLRRGSGRSPSPRRCSPGCWCRSVRSPPRSRSPATSSCFTYLFALGRFFTAAAALDTGSPFEGMGAAREVGFAWLTEPALFFAFLASGPHLRFPAPLPDAARDGGGPVARAHGAAAADRRRTLHRPARGVQPHARSTIPTPTSS